MAKPLKRKSGLWLRFQKKWLYIIYATNSTVLQNMTIGTSKQDEAHETRMLTRMLMVQVSIHMIMQSRTIPFCNSLFEQSCACSLVTSLQCGVESVECGVWSVK